VGIYRASKLNKTRNRSTSTPYSKQCKNVGQFGSRWQILEATSAVSGSNRTVFYLSVYSKDEETADQPVLYQCPYQLQPIHPQSWAWALIGQCRLEIFWKASTVWAALHQSNASNGQYRARW